MNKIQHEWPDPIIPERDECLKTIDINNFDNDDLLTRVSWEIHKQIQFPINTTFMHSLGVVAAAMAKSFSYKFRGSEKPCNLYVVSSQPPSSGKSGVNDFLTRPMLTAYMDLNKKNKVRRAILESKIKDLKKILKDASNEIEIDKVSSDLDSSMEELDNTPIYQVGITNTTPEALEDICFKQGNFWNLVSDEAGSINTLLGQVYSDKPANADIVLQSWDGDWMKSARISRDTGMGYVRGSLAVIAQDETIRTILEAGTRGNGVSERFLLYREPDMMGYRDHTEIYDADRRVMADYANLINKLVYSDQTILKFSDDAIQVIIDEKIRLEPDLKEGGRYSNNMFRGYVGKMEKQVMKLSCVLHVMTTWGKSTPLVIEADTVKRAAFTFRQLVKVYEKAADSQGYIGDNSEVEEVIAQFQKLIEKKKNRVTATTLGDRVKHRPAFKGRTKIASYLKETILPKCEELNLCHLVNGDVYINPKLI